MISFRQRGNFNNTETFLKHNVVNNYMSILERYAKDGLNALIETTPKDSGDTANSWRYVIKNYPDSGKIVISWLNSNITESGPVAILIQYGHATKNGGYVEGRDYINPALKSVFDNMANEVWKEVVK